ncbi:tRNA lysidine(34) synthetase TilS [Salinicoccus sp. HZC-1]|uniref:tRNA lysidine(34) synthetase TilS n=1 Tax=Salinicoccus sp. HZC-1 TaxID=3385497 RepID=UPI00398AAC20
MELKCSWSKSETVALAISGGVDSMVLYHLLKTSYSETFRRLILLHVNHGQRAASMKEAAYIEVMAQRDNVHCETIKLDLPHEDFSQARAREERYRFFDEMMVRHGAAVLLTAHHLDDQYESVLHQVLTGRYLPGKMGIPAVRTAEGYRIARPLIKVTRNEIEDYAGAEGVTYFEDETNNETAYTRNYIRHNLVPHIKTSSHLQQSQLLNLADDLSEVDDMLREDALRFLKDAPSVLSRAVINKKRRISRIYILNHWLSSAGLYPRRKYIEEMLDIADSDVAQAEFPIGDSLLVISYDEIYLEQRGKKIIKRLEIPRNGVYDFNGYKITVEMDEDDLPLTARTRQDGDRIKLLGVGHKKISRLFIDHKVSKSDRESMPVITDRHHQIIAVGTIYNIMETQRKHSRLLIEKGVKQ